MGNRIVMIHGGHLLARLKTGKKHRVFVRCGKTYENRLTSEFGVYVRLFFPAL